MYRYFRLSLLAILLAIPSFAVDYGPQYAPTSETAVTTSTSRLKRMLLSNESAGSVTVTIKDRTTNCGGSACTLFASVPIAANTTYTVDLGGVVAQGGFTVVASDPTAVVIWVGYQICATYCEEIR